MNKKLIDSAWRILPAEFKRVVKAHYAGLNAAYKAYLSKDSLTNAECDRCNAIREKISIYSMYFGIHNLTSDAEEEEMLTVSRKRVQELYKRNSDKIGKLCEVCNADEISKCDARCGILLRLFGTKCLPDEACNVASSDVASNVASSKPKSAEPKFKRCKKVITPSGEVCIIEDTHFENGCWLCLVGDPARWIPESDLEPYTEPKESPRQFYRVMGTDEHGRQVVIPIPPQLAGPYDISKERTEPEESTCTETCTDACSSQCKSQDFDNILKDSFSKERRLNIAAMIMASMMQNTRWGDKYSHIANMACAAADALIAEAEKGGDA